MNVISVNNVSKIYPLYDKPVDRLKETLSLTHKIYHKDFYALENINFNIKKGETVGIVGTNGSGKSTILKIITGVLNPTEGSVHVDGKISALLELGAGFNMEYTGIENLYMNGTLMGYTREEMDAKIPEILEFADIGDFVYQPVKTYSSGMFVRLAFALSVTVEPEVMIVDEALSVGDAFFQAKCFSKLEEIKLRGTTILFVSHDMLSVKKLCNRAIWIEKGHVRMDGDASEVCEAYLSMQIEENNRQKQKLVDQIQNENAMDANKQTDKALFRKLNLDAESQISSSGRAEIVSFYIRDEDGNDVNVLGVEKTYTFGVVAKFHENIKNALFGFELENTKGTKLFSINNFLSDKVLEEAKRDSIYEVSFAIKLPRICAGEYLVSPSLASGNQTDHVVHMRLHNYMLITVDNEGYNLSLIDLDTETELKEYKAEQIEFYD